MLQKDEPSPVRGRDAHVPGCEAPLRAAAQPLTRPFSGGYNQCTQNTNFNANSCPGLVDSFECYADDDWDTDDYYDDDYLGDDDDAYYVDDDYYGSYDYSYEFSYGYYSFPYYADDDFYDEFSYSYIIADDDFWDEFSYSYIIEVFSHSYSFLE